MCNCSAAMKRMLLDGTTLIVDRYAFSGVAYSAAKTVRNLPTILIHFCKISDGFRVGVSYLDLF